MPHTSALGLLCLTASLMLAGTQSEEAARAMRDQRFDEAVKLYQRLCLQSPGNAALHLDLAAALNSAGKYSEALRELQSIRTSEKQNGKFWFLLGVIEAKLDDPAKAIDPLLRAVELEPENNEARLEAASTLLELGRFPDAEKQYRLLAIKLPNLPKVWQGLALAETALSQRALQELKRTAPNSSYLYGLAALAAADSGNASKAIDLYQKALALPPEAAWMRLEMVALQSGTSRPPCHDSSYACRFAVDDVQGLGREVEALHSPDALYWSTRIYAQLARDSTQTLAGLPPSPELHELLARLYSQNGRRADAITELREAVKLRPGDLLATSDLAEALWADRQYEESIRLLSPLLQSNPRRGYWQFEMGDSLFNLGRSDQAIIHLKEAARLSPELLPAQAKLGEALLRMGDATGALPHLERAQAMDRDGSIHFQLAAAYRKLGNAAAASKAIQRQKELVNPSTGNSPKAPDTP